MSTCTDWEWWQATPTARSPAKKEWDQDIPATIKGEFARLMERWETGDLQPAGGDCKRLNGDITYLRVRRGNNHYRLYFAMRGSVAVVLHVAYKNQQTIDKATMALLKKRASSGTSREVSTRG